MPGLSVKKQRQALQRQRDELSKSLNALSYPNTLPVEVLSYIFALHSAMVCQVRGASQKKRSAERVRIAHVCRHWRAIAIDNAELWSDLLFTSAEIVKLMVGRSKEAPLTVAMRQVDTRLHAPLSEILSSQAHRLRSVEVTDISYPEFVSLLTTPTPVLEKLVLAFEDQMYKADPRRPDLPDHLLHDNPPALTHLEIMDFAIPRFEMLPLVPSLKHLRLGSQNHSMPVRPPAEALLSALQQLPHLETLTLANYVPTDVYPPKMTDNPVECPSLRSVSIVGSILSLHGLLNAIRIPNASVEIVFTDPVETLDAFLITLAKARKVTDRKLSLQTLTVRTGWPQDSRFLFEFGFDDDTAVSNSDPRISFGFTRPILITFQSLMEALMVAFMDWDSLRTLHIDTSRWSLGKDEWQILGLLPYLKAITFSCNADIEEFSNLLNEGSTLGSMGVTHPQAHAFPIFPALTSLSFEGAHLIQGSPNREILVSALNKRPSPHRVRVLKAAYNDEDFSQDDVNFYQTSVPGLRVEWEQDDDMELDTEDEWDSEEESEEEE